MAAVIGGRVCWPLSGGALVFCCGGSPCGQPLRCIGQRRPFGSAVNWLHILLGAQLDATGPPAGPGRARHRTGNGPQHSSYLRVCKHLVDLVGRLPVHGPADRFGQRRHQVDIGHGSRYALPVGAADSCCELGGEHRRVPRGRTGPPDLSPGRAIPGLSLPATGLLDQRPAQTAATRACQKTLRILGPVHCHTVTSRRTWLETHFPGSVEPAAPVPVPSRRP